MLARLLRPKDLRYERKFVISELTKQEVEFLVKLHPAMFSEIYHQRFVNNLYFDSFDIRNYFDTADGTKDRIKTRIRWYGDLFGAIENPVLEFKIKDGLLGGKVSFSLIPFSIDKNFQYDTITSVVRDSDVPDDIKVELLALEPSLLNRYCRKYYQSADSDYRITIDSEMEFFRVNLRYNSFLHQLVDRVNTVCELKYDSDRDLDAERISNFFPFRMTKSSKYLNGIEALQLEAWDDSL